MKPRYKAIAGGLTPQLRFTVGRKEPGSCEVVIGNMLALLRLADEQDLGAWAQARGFAFTQRSQARELPLIHAVANECKVPWRLVAGHLHGTNGRRRRFWLYELEFRTSVYAGECTVWVRSLRADQ